jgi:hypothetical protein
MALVIRVKTLEKEVAAIEEFTQSVQVIKPGEVSTSPATAVLLGAIA